MAIFHLSAGFVSRSTGRSSVQSAAYITGTQLYETRRDLIADYRNRSSDIVFSTTLFPKQVPEALKNLNIWDKIETYEDTYARTRYRTEETQSHYQNTAQVAQTIVVALPKELRPDLWKELVVDFANERFVARGLVVTVAIHNDEGNPHAHFQISRRSLNEKGEWSWAKDRAIVTKSALLETRSLWAEKVNASLEREGFIERIDHRSYADLGLPFEPTKHVGWFGQKLERTGQLSRIVEENKDIRAYNKTLASLEPEHILEELCIKQATFSSTDLARLIQTRVGDDAKLNAIVYEASLQKALLVGTSVEGQARYSSPGYAAKEHQALAFATTLATQKSFLAIHPSLTVKALEGAYAHLNTEQQQAVYKLCAPVQLGVMIGRAGTGKTTTLRAVVHCHEQASYKVLGLSLSATAAENLSLEAGVSAETIAFYLDKWQRLEVAKEKYFSFHPSPEHNSLQQEILRLEPYSLSKDHLLIVDEAGMVGTAQWHALMTFVQKAGAKLIAVGDNHQFKAIDAGDFLRKFIEIAQTQGTLCQLERIQRQQAPWMREASIALAELRTYEALASYENQGLIQTISPGSEGLRLIAQQYLTQCLENPEKTGLLMAYTRAECTALNTEIRALLKEQGLIKPEDFVFNHEMFSVNDQIVFLKNDRQKSISTYDPSDGSHKDFLIKNGTMGQIIDIEVHIAKSLEGEPTTLYTLTVAINATTYGRFNIEDYDAFSHAYATTLHKSQGRTVDWSLILASKYMDAYAIYVALTRHRETTTLFYDQSLFPNFKTLQSSLAKLSHKDLVIDYTIDVANQGSWENVQEYKFLGQDLSATIKEQNWGSYQALKTERVALGKLILAEWSSHESYARQAGLSHEAIAIYCGLKMRPLSLAESQAKDTVTQYGHKVLEARLLWKEITQTCPGQQCYRHEHYQAFTELRQERNALAKTITAYPALHKEFVQELGRTQGIGWKTLEAQATQEINFKLYELAGQKKLERNKDHPDRFSGSKGQVIYSPRFDRVEPRHIKAELEQNIANLAFALLGKPTRETPREWRYGQHGSLSVCVAGTKQGLYANFEEGSYGGPLKLIQDQCKLDYKEAYQWALAWLGHSHLEAKIVPFKQPLATQEQKIEQKQWTALDLIPEQAPSPDLKNNRSLCYPLVQEGRLEIERYAYHNLEGRLLGYTVRLENKKGEKVVLPLSYCENKQGEQQWRWQGFGGDSKPLYGLDRLAAHSLKPVLLVEGEKTANAAQRLLPEMVVLSWLGGTGSVAKIDLTPLLGKQIYLWPDHDAPGIRAMDKIEARLLELHQNQQKDPEIHKISLPSSLPLKWDLADPFPEGWHLAKVRQLLGLSDKSLETPKLAIGQDKILGTLSPIGLTWPYYEAPMRVSERINYLYEESIGYHRSLNILLTPQKIHEIEGKSIIAGTLHAWIQERFFNQESYWSGFNKASDVALIAAEIKIKVPDPSRNEAQLIVEAHQIFKSYQEKIEQDLLTRFGNTFSKDSLACLSQEVLRHYQHTQQFPNPKQEQILLNKIQLIQERMSADRPSIDLPIVSLVHESLKNQQQTRTISLENRIQETIQCMDRQQTLEIDRIKEQAKIKALSLNHDQEPSL